jgi:hypothetical protein
MFMDRKTQYHQDVNSSTLYLEIWYNLDQNPSNLFCRYQQTDSKVYMVEKACIIAKSKLNNMVGLTLPDFKVYYKATVIKTTWYW